ncbi:MAG: 5'-nucleotidase C-terminal domain-containing protein [Solobacterium sp.]|jgi:2',3'-cyclic-nucleotide 2'-phosphodiesterase (5'-nucleotidase family)|nr:5'-nucleotidase C-terminal domain-containing protein [Solobacterium sp.]MCH4049168.1 5'-nucleotidase C-terminal domain-containing protein [Solobacterium sp.]MCH4074078.1 5'-nucleotidase C-terminal domain-containing protein [Solobacterium sp.]MCI1313318.1 5'-nucleotidase C-terminal domain-containing protein [Solobacterium sp.]MCI1346161.1 5'-nucleotidase C-terminal domain-containing protein [Solobacterium sp.]
MKFTKKIMSTALAAVMTAAVMPAAVQAEETAGTASDYTFEVMSTTDMHGRGTTTDVATQREDSNSMERVSTIVKEERAAIGSDKTLLIDNGDLYQGTLITQYQMSNCPEKENQMITCLREIGYDASVMGNHEFNYTIEQRDTQARYLENAGIPVLDANLVLKTDGKKFDGTAARAGDPYYQPYTIKEFKFGTAKDGKHENKVSVAVIGLGNAANATWDQADHYANLQFSSLDNPQGLLEKEINKWTSYIRDKKLADIVIVSAHSGKGTDDGVESDKFMLESQAVSGTKKSRGMDLLIYGHDHTANAEVQKDADGKDVWMVNGGGTAVTKTKFSVNFNEDGSVKDYAVSETPSLLALKNVTSDNTLNSDSNIQGLYKKTVEWAKKPFGNFGTGWNDVKAEAEGKTNDDMITRQTALMNLVGKAMIWSTWQSYESERIAGATVAFASPVFQKEADGKLSYVPSDGDSINTMTIAMLYRFGNNLSCCVEMTGNQIYTWMSTVADRYAIDESGNPCIAKGESIYGMDTFYGIDYTFDLTKPEGSRVVKALYNGKPLKGSAEIIRVAMNNYRLSGGYDFTKNTGISEENAVWTADKYLGSDRSPMIAQIGEYVKYMKTVTPSDKVSHGNDSSWNLITKAAEKPDETASPEPAEKTAVSMYRVYNPNSGEHFFTSAKTERDHLISLGWKDEGTGWKSPEKSDTPVYRLYNANGGEHHYTADAHEKEVLVSLGWKDEGIGWYSDEAKGTPVYRAYNPNEKANNHHYTANAAEDKYLIRIGWHDEGIAWYGLAE